MSKFPYLIYGALKKHASSHLRTIQNLHQTLKQIWIRSNQFGINNSPKILGEWINLNVDDYILSVAYLRNLSTSA